MDRELLQQLVDQSLSVSQIARRLNTTHARTAYWIAKFDLKPRKDPAGRKPDADLLSQLYETRLQILRLQSAEKKIIKQLLLEEGVGHGRQTADC